MSFRKMSPPYGQLDGQPLSKFCRDLGEAKDVIDTQEEYIASLHKEINQLRKDIAYIRAAREKENMCYEYSLKVKEREVLTEDGEVKVMPVDDND